MEIRNDVAIQPKPRIANAPDITLTVRVPGCVKFCDGCVAEFY